MGDHVKMYSPALLNFSNPHIRLNAICSAYVLEQFGKRGTVKNISVDLSAGDRKREKV